MTNASVGHSVDKSYLRDSQYRDSRKLEARANLHRRYERRSQGNWFDWIARNASIEPHASVLDIGCGPGWLWEEAADALPDGLRLTLADLSVGMVEDAVSRAQGAGRCASVDGQVSDASALPFTDLSFDTVLACHMLYHVPDPEAAVAEMLRVLRPGGVLCVTTNLEGNMGPLYALGAAIFGGSGSDPAADIFGLQRAEKVMTPLFENVVVERFEGELHVTSVEDLVFALTSFPPGDSADEAAVERLHDHVAAEMARHGGTIIIPKTQGMVRGVKA
jgi:ubiquinone/menaquinone biosynthesis C-methylase UbiE